MNKRNKVITSTINEGVSINFNQWNPGINNGYTPTITNNNNGFVKYDKPVKFKVGEPIKFKQN